MTIREILRLAKDTLEERAKKRIQRPLTIKFTIYPSKDYRLQMDLDVYIKRTTSQEYRADRQPVQDEK